MVQEIECCVHGTECDLRNFLWDRMCRFKRLQGYLLFVAFLGCDIILFHRTLWVWVSCGLLALWALPFVIAAVIARKLYRSQSKGPGEEGGTIVMI